MTTEASVILAFVQDLPQKTKQTLAYLLARDLAESGLGDQSPASRLGLIVDLIVEREGELPSVRDYEDSRRSADIRWPSASQIVRTYGSWVTAIRTATAVGQAGRTPRKLVTYPSHAYTRDGRSIPYCGASKTSALGPRRCGSTQLGPRSLARHNFTGAILEIES
jgi:hypothetical protein